MSRYSRDEMKEIMKPMAIRLFGDVNFEEIKLFYKRRVWGGKFNWRQDFKTKGYFVVLESCENYKKKELELHIGEYLVWENGEFSIEKEYNDRIKDIWNKKLTEV